MAETKLFHIGDYLSITSGKLVSPKHVDGIYNILGWMTGEDLMTHQLSRVSRECEPFLREQHPALAAVDVPAGLDSWEKVDAFLTALYPDHGQFVSVAQIPSDEHTAIDPIDEMRMIRPDAKIIGVDLTNG